MVKVQIDESVGTVPLSLALAAGGLEIHSVRGELFIKPRVLKHSDESVARLSDADLIAQSRIWNQAGPIVRELAKRFARYATERAQVEAELARIEGNVKPLDGATAQRLRDEVLAAQKSFTAALSRLMDAGVSL